MLEQGLALTDALRRHLPRGVVERQDDVLLRVGRAPDVAGRRVVLVDLAERRGLPPAVLVLRLLALDRKRAAQKRHEVLLAELADARAVSDEVALAGKLVRVQLVVRAVVLRRLDQRLQVRDGFRRPRLPVIPAGGTQERRVSACGKPLRPEVVDLGLADAESIDCVLQGHFAFIEPSYDTLDHIGAEPRVELLFLHAAYYRMT